MNLKVATGGAGGGEGLPGGGGHWLPSKEVLRGERTENWGAERGSGVQLSSRGGTPGKRPAEGDGRDGRGGGDSPCIAAPQITGAKRRDGAGPAKGLGELRGVGGRLGGWRRDTPKLGWAFSSGSPQHPAASVPFAKSDDDET